jgi:predicted glutamine amidotransferase
MCLIFYSYNRHTSKKLLDKFISFSKIKTDHYLYGGIGFAWIDRVSNKWDYIRRLKIYENSESFPQDMLSNRVIVGLIRQTYHGSAKKAIENVHPFSYRNQIFVHNGDTSRFNETSQLFFNDIDKELRTHIKGNTDTEHIFYMFLTIKKQFDTHETLNDEIDILFKTTELLFQYLRRHYKKFRTNFVYSNKSHSVIVRNSFSDNAKLLYLNGDPCSDKLLITSSPVMDTCKLIPNHTIILVDHAKNTYITKKLNTV